MYTHTKGRALALSGALSIVLALAACSGEPQSSPTPSTKTSPTSSTQAQTPSVKAKTNTVKTSNAYAGEGREIYADYCAACHQANGEGIDDIYPAFANNEFVTGDSEELIFLMLEGRAGMPAFYEDLTPEEIKDVINHLRSNWGNQAALVTQAQVDAAIDEIGDNDGAFSRDDH